MRKMRNNAFVGNTGHFDNEIDITILLLLASVRFDFNIQAGNGDLLPVHLPPVWGATARTCGGTLCKRMEGLRTVLQLTLRVRAAVRLCTGAVYSSDSSSANSSDKLNMPQPGGHVTASSLSTGHVEEIFTSRVGPTDKFDWFKDFIMGSSGALWLHVLKVEIIERTRCSLFERVPGLQMELDHVRQVPSWDPGSSGTNTSSSRDE